MSQKAIEITPILPSPVQDWTDLNKDGKKLNKILNICYKKMTPRKGKTPMDDATFMGYIQCVCRLTHQKADLVQTVLGIKQALEEAKKR